MYRSEKYLDFIRSKPCVKCKHETYGKDDPNPVTAHHVPLKNGGVALKCPDSQTIPLCLNEHIEEENVPASIFWKGYYLEKIIIEHLTEYLEVSNG